MRSYKNRCCYCCKKVRRFQEGEEAFVIANGLRYPDDLATVEHVYPKSDIRRLLAPKARALACYKCNSQKGIADNPDHHPDYKNLEKPSLIYLLLA